MNELSRQETDLSAGECCARAQMASYARRPLPLPAPETFWKRVVAVIRRRFAPTRLSP